MSSIKSLVKKIELFERFALYGDRGSFLKSLAQDTRLHESNDAAILAAAKALDEGIGGWIAQAGQFDAGGGLPEGVKGLPASYANAAATIKDFVLRPSFIDIDVLNNLKATTQKLMAIDTHKDISASGKQSWMSLVYPHAKQLMSEIEKQIQYLTMFKEHYSPRDLTEEKSSPTNPAAKPAPKFNPDPEAVKSLQIFLNNAFRKDIIEGKRGPIRQDGMMGPETIGALKQWAKNNNVNSNDVQELMDIVLGKK